MCSFTIEPFSQAFDNVVVQLQINVLPFKGIYTIVRVQVCADMVESSVISMVFKSAGSPVILVK
jgi:hypothetical protein